MTSLWRLPLLLLLPLSCLTGFASADPDYLDALTKSIIFYEGQRSGKVDLSTLRAKWRGDSALQDGISQGVRPLTTHTFLPLFLPASI